MKKKVKFTLNAFGVILDKNDDVIKARIYDSKTYEIIDDITFSCTEFSTADRKKLDLFLVFTWRIGYIGSKPFNNFRLKVMEPYGGLSSMTKEKSIVLSLRCFHETKKCIANSNFDFVEA